MIRLVLVDERGQTLMEYGLILVFVAVAVVVGLTVFGDVVVGLWTQIVALF
jgi:Flp pilus assembly pilin Flp